MNARADFCTDPEEQVYQANKQFEKKLSSRLIQSEAEFALAVRAAKAFAAKNPCPGLIQALKQPLKQPLIQPIMTNRDEFNYQIQPTWYGRSAPLRPLSRP